LLRQKYKGSNIRKGRVKAAMGKALGVCPLLYSLITSLKGFGTPALPQIL
jgi:hypothetical protein